MFMIWRLHKYFNPRSHKGSDVLDRKSYLLSKQFQSTLPQGERHVYADLYNLAPVDFNPRSHKGSDDGLAQGRKNMARISIHAPTRGATAACFCNLKQSPISIHAPTRGATYSVPEDFQSIQDFNPRSHKGSDLVSLATEYTYNLFQSTLPQGERRIRVPVYG